MPISAFAAILRDARNNALLRMRAERLIVG
jgi:hypothetical protein